MRPRLLLSICILSAGCLDAETDEVGTTSGEVSVTWTNLVGVSASGNDLTKTDPTSAWNAGAVSVETLASDGYVELTVGETGTAKAAGLSSGDGGQRYTDIDFALRFTAGDAVQVLEGGVLRGSFGTYAAGDRFRVEVKGGVVRYSRSGAPPFYTSAVAPSFPLGVDTAFYTPGATINDVELVATALTWQNVVGVAASGDTLTKTGGTSGFNAGASSVQTLAGDGFMEFAVADNTTAKAAGLSSGDSGQSYTDIDYGLRLTAGGGIQVYEGGVLRGTFGNYLGGDRFRVEVAGGVVAYSMNGGAPFYTSAVPPTFPLGIDTSISTPGATLNDLALVEAANACPAYDGTGLVCSGSFVVNNSFDLAEIASCANITGNLTITAPGMTEIALPLLERIGGDFTVTNNPDTTRFRLPALKEIGGLTSISLNPATAGIDLSGLRTADRLETRTFGNLDVAYPCLDTSGTLYAREWNGSTDLTAPIHVPRLRRVVGGFISAHMTAPLLESVSGTVSVGTISAPALISVSGDISNPYLDTPKALVDAPNLTDVGGTVHFNAGHNLPALTRVGSLNLLDVPSVDLPLLVEITGTLQAGASGSFCSSTAPATATVNLPALTTAGAIHICSNALEQLSVPQLQVLTGPAVDGNVLFIRSTGLTEPVAFSALTLVKGGLTMYAAGNFPVLERARGGLTARAPLDMPALVDVRLGMTVYAQVTVPSLVSVGGNLNFNVPLSADRLTTVGGMLKPRAGAVYFPSLTSVDGIYSFGGGPLSLDLPALTQVVGAGAGTYAGRIYLHHTGVTTISMPQLISVASHFQVIGNDLLTSLDFASLTSVGPILEITRNRNLPNCYATNLVDQLVTAGWTGTASIYDNGTGTCP